MIQFKNSFNTSHVTVYHIMSIRIHMHAQFQYISCYGLSCTALQFRRLNRVSIHLMLRFIMRTIQTMISFIVVSIHLMLRFICCCRHGKVRYWIGFNTSHVTVYPLQIINRTMFLLRFNTSHVTVYPAALFGSRLSTRVSIHLMLRFILL